ncbi:trypsin-4-like [Xylocopa sonorina]|uniref:trypsin-4-like n=1 Tax=Xylocopa sonorina TaxID=1818115 RepID=UPI00403B2D43
MFQKVSLLFCILFADTLAYNARFANITEYPYHVSIEKYDRHACSGALIHESWVITAASCVFRTDLSVVNVRVRTSTTSSGGDQLQVSNIVVHEDFDKHLLGNDIALIKLKIPVQFGAKLLPIGLPQKESHQLRDGTNCFVTGWRQILPGVEETKLSVITVPLVNQKTCNSKMPCHKPLFQKMLCAGNMTYGVETCQDDPGAPLMEGQTLIGVLSYGLGCKTMIHPGVYTRVSSYLRWISTYSGIRFT